jgi:ParB/RepB/Spo0J family partition protein
MTESGLIRGTIEALSKEGEVGAPAGNCWVKFRNLAETFLVSVGVPLKVGQEIRARTVGSKFGPMLDQVEVLAEQSTSVSAIHAELVAEKPNLTPETTRPPGDSLVSTQPTTPHRKAEGYLEFLDLKQLEESPWNPNEMNDETFASLIQDMREGGYFIINPIQVFPLEAEPSGVVHYQIIDGHWRYKAARKIPWEKIRAEVLDVEEPEAKVLNYRKNHERGTLNPEKEAKLFFEDWEKGNGKLTQQQIADKYGVSQTYVSERVAGVALYSAGIKPTHAEEIFHSVKNEDAQKAIARASVKQKLTPNETREVAERVANEVKVKPNAPKKFLKAKAERFAREVKKARVSPNAPVEIESIFCEDCDATFRILHLGMNRHRVVRAPDKEKETIE